MFTTTQEAIENSETITITPIINFQSEEAFEESTGQQYENMTLSGLFEQLLVDHPDPKAASTSVLSGGPVGTERGFVLHDKSQSYENTLCVSDDIQLTVSRDVLDAMATGDGPEKSLVAIGYAGWTPGQLEQEMLANSWLSVLATPELVFDAPYAERWDLAARTLGIDIASISPDAGHA